MHTGTSPPPGSLSTPVLPRRTPPPLQHIDHHCQHPHQSAPLLPPSSTSPPQLPSLSCSTLPSPVSREAGVTTATATATPRDVLRQLLREWYSGVAELLLGEVAAADVLGYRAGPHLHACELAAPSGLAEDNAATAGGVMNETEVLLEEVLSYFTSLGYRSRVNSGSGGSSGGGSVTISPSLPSSALRAASHTSTLEELCSGPTEQLISRLTHFIPSLQSTTAADGARRASGASPLDDNYSNTPHSPPQHQIQWPQPQRLQSSPPLLHESQPHLFTQRALAMPSFEAREEFSSVTNGPPSPSISMPTALPQTSAAALDTTAAALTATRSTSAGALPTLPRTTVTAGMTGTADAAVPVPWWYAVVDVVNAALDAVDTVVDTIFTAQTHSAGEGLLPLVSTSADSLGASTTKEGAPVDASLVATATATAAAATEEEESCIMAGLLLSRQVRVRHGAAYTAVIPPLLVVLDLDLTVLRVPFSAIRLRGVPAMPTAELRALFVDVDFFCGFCEAATRRGHKLAICSLTEGAADQHVCGFGVAEAVVALLSAVLPPTRGYLCSVEDVVCLPKSVAGPGKLFHLQLLQQRCNAREKLLTATPTTTTTTTASNAAHAAKANISGTRAMDANISGCSYATGGAAVDSSGVPSANLSYSSRDAMEGIVCQANAPVLLPRWLSTDVVLIDDDKENCRLAVTQGYHAAHCTDTGLSARWFAARPDVQVLLGLTMDDIPRPSFRGCRSAVATL